MNIPLLRALALSLTLGLGATLPGQVLADKYLIDTKGAHAFIQFRIKHLGFSWLLGRFDRFSGSFTYDEKQPESATVEVSIDTASINSNHAERDKHLRGKDFLDVKRFPQARFVSTRYLPGPEGKAALEGELTLHGVTRPITIEVEETGHGKDPWGGYRRGFQGVVTLTLADFGIDYDLGPASRQVELFLSVEGIRQ